LKGLKYVIYDNYVTFNCWSCVFLVASNDGAPMDATDNNDQTNEEEKEINMREK